jgi:hypothetical protein
MSSVRLHPIEASVYAYTYHKGYVFIYINRYVCIHTYTSMYIRKAVLHVHTSQQYGGISPGGDCETAVP